MGYFVGGAMVTRLPKSCCVQYDVRRLPAPARAQACFQKVRRQIRFNDFVYPFMKFAVDSRGASHTEQGSS
jgi:hypothetical protein